MCAQIVDTVLEATIVGSFTKIGPAVRSRLDDWEPVTTDLSGSVIVVTGGSAGIGRETAAQLVGLGADVWITSRALDRAEEAANEINRSNPQGEAIGAEVDTGDFDSVNQLADRIIAETPAVDVLIHNAGALSDTYETSPSGIEATLASHLVGPYLLTKRLKPHLSSGGRVLWMSSGGMYTQGLDVDELEMSESNYKGTTAYARAKRAQVELVSHLGRAWAPDVRMQAMHPGWVATSGVSDALPGFNKVVGPLLRDASQGADTMVWLAAGGADDAAPGQFWLDRRPRATSYLPGTNTTEAERQRLVDWLDGVLISLD